MSSRAQGRCYGAFGRVLSLVLAAPLALVLLIHPAAMLDGQGGYSHPQLMLVMWGISAGFVHGVGFVPQWWGLALAARPAAGLAVVCFGLRGAVPGPVGLSGGECLCSQARRFVG